MSRHPLDIASAELLERLDKEHAREPSTPSTTLVGGIAKVASKIDDLVQALLLEVARLAARPAEEFLPTVGKKKPSLRKTPAGQVLNAVLDASKGIALPPTVRACVEDARQRRTSVLWKTIQLRNDAVHQGVVPAEAGKALRRLAELVERYRREAGWDE